jgi:hypothetical protein
MAHDFRRAGGVLVDADEGTGDSVEEGLLEVRKRRDTLHNLPPNLLAMVDGGTLSKQGRVDLLLASKTPAEVRCTGQGLPRVFCEANARMWG